MDYVEYIHTCCKEKMVNQFIFLEIWHTKVSTEQVLFKRACKIAALGSLLEFSVPSF